MQREQFGAPIRVVPADPGHARGLRGGHRGQPRVHAPGGVGGRLVSPRAAEPTVSRWAAKPTVSRRGVEPTVSRWAAKPRMAAGGRRCTRRRRWRSCRPRRRPVGRSSTGASRSSAAAGMTGLIRSNGCTAKCGSTGSGRHLRDPARHHRERNHQTRHRVPRSSGRVDDRRTAPKRPPRHGRGGHRRGHRHRPPSRFSLPAAAPTS